MLPKIRQVILDLTSLTPFSPLRGDLLQFYLTSTRYPLILILKQKMSALPASLKYTVLDAFTRQSFRGNLATVFVLEAPLPDSTMLSISGEMNLPVSAFCVARKDEPGHFDLRWFQTTHKISPCGHATLATATHLFSDQIYVPSDMHLIKFFTKAGELTARKLDDGPVELNFPTSETHAAEPNLLSRVQEITGWALSGADSKPKIKFIGSSTDEQFSHFLLVEVDSSFDLASRAVSIPLFVSSQNRSDSFLDLMDGFQKEILSHHSIIITAQSAEPDVAFVSRMFALRQGLDEDHTTGSSHCVLGPYWTKRLGLTPGAELAARQLSARGGVLGAV